MRVRIGDRWFPAPRFTGSPTKGQRAEMSAFLREILAEQKRLLEARFSRKNAMPDFFADMLKNVFKGGS